MGLRIDYKGTWLVVVPPGINPVAAVIMMVVVGHYKMASDVHAVMADAETQSPTMTTDVSISTIMGVTTVPVNAVPVSAVSVSMMPMTAAMPMLSRGRSRLKETCDRNHACSG